MEHKGQPTVILAKTVKGYGLGEAGEGRNISHQQKKMNEKELREFRARFDIPISDEEIARNAVLSSCAGQHGNEISAGTPQKTRRFSAQARGQGASRCRRPQAGRVSLSSQRQRAARVFDDDGRLSRLVEQLLRDKKIGRNIVPIIPDEARTFGMDAHVPRSSAFIRPKASSTSRSITRLAALLSRSEGRPDSRRRHHRSGFDVVVHRRGHRLRQARRAT